MQEIISTYHWYLIAFAAGFAIALFLVLTIMRHRITNRMATELRGRQNLFVGLASHYLLTPISIIQTALAALQDQDATLNADGRQRYYEMINRGQQRLWIITERLMLIGDIDQRTLELKLEVRDLTAVLSDAVTAVDVFAREKGMKIHIQDTTKNVQQSRMDSDRLKQAFIAVMDNAIKFGLENTTINISIGYADAVFSIVVEDQGVGMPDEIMEHVSERFYRGTQLYSFNYEGLGLGLNIANTIFRAHQGNIFYDSKPKQGTKVLIELPAL